MVLEIGTAAVVETAAVPLQAVRALIPRERGQPVVETSVRLV